MRRCLSLLVLALLSATGLPFAAHAESEQDRAVAAIEKLGGKVERDPKAPGQPGITVILDDVADPDAALEQVKALKTVTKVSAENAPVTDAGLAHLRGATQLKTLIAPSPKLTDAGLASLEGMTQLRSL